MSDIIKMEYDLMRAMKQTFLEGVEQLQDTMQEMQSIASALEDGALLGRGGQAFTDALRGKLCPAISRLIEKYNEMAQDVQDAMEFMQAADDTSEAKF
jgi:WXG100 family type VII secretion target